MNLQTLIECWIIIFKSYLGRNKNKRQSAPRMRTHFLNETKSIINLVRIPAYCRNRSFLLSINFF